MGSIINRSNHQDGTSCSAPSTTRARDYIVAESRMRRGKRLTISGVVVAIVGVIGYCIGWLGAGVNQELGPTLLENPPMLVISSLSGIALGTLLWLVGSVLYMNGMMDGDPDRPDIF